MYIHKTEICKFKRNSNTSWYNFCFESVSKDFIKNEQNALSLNNAVYDFSVDHSSVKKVDIINIHECFMVKNNIKK